MPDSAVYRPHREDPAVATLRSVPASNSWTGLSVEHFELVSRGDFVPGVLYRPLSPGDASESGSPLLLLQHAAADGADASYLACAASWVAAGLAVACVDLPLHGSRSSPKLSARLVSEIGRVARGEELDLDSRALVEEFARQTTSDLIRTLDALSAIDGIDENRVGFMGFGLGAIAGSYLLAHDSRPRAAVLALAGGGRGPTDLDPVTYLERAAGTLRESALECEVLVVVAEDHERIAAEDVDALFQAAPKPKELLRYAGGSRELPKETLGKIEEFLRRTLSF